MSTTFVKLAPITHLPVDIPIVMSYAVLNVAGGLGATELLFALFESEAFGTLLYCTKYIKRERARLLATTVCSRHREKEKAGWVDSTHKQKSTLEVM